MLPLPKFQFQEVGPPLERSVKVTVNGKKQVIAIDIDSSILRSEDRTLIQDLVVAAVNKANEEVEILAKEELRKSTDGILPSIPGIDFSSLMGG